MSDSANPAAPPAVDRALDDEDTIEHAWARIGTRLALIACGFAIAGGWTCGMSNWLALPLGVGAAWLGYRSYTAAGDRTATRAYAKVAMIAGLLAALSAGLYLVVLGSWFALFMVLTVLGS